MGWVVGWVYGLGRWVGLRDGSMGGFAKGDNRFGYAKSSFGVRFAPLV